MPMAKMLEWLKYLDSPFTAEAVFDLLPGVAYFIKDREGRYVVVNQTLADRCAMGKKERLLGKTALEAYPAHLGQIFHQQDMQVIQTAKALRNELELHLDEAGTTCWCLTDKLPLCNSHGTANGLVGISRDLQAPQETTIEYTPLATALKYARGHLADRFSVKDFAAKAKLSPYQLDQRLRALFHLTAGQLLLKWRMEQAVTQLRETDSSIADISSACGYADQSAFTRQFRRATGFTPLQFRQVR
jgi:AraC-like DNA-binding protein